MQKGYIDELNNDYSKLLNDQNDSKFMAVHSKLYYYITIIVDNTTRPYSHTSLAYNPPRKFVSKKEAHKDLMMHSFDNILAPLEIKSQADQISPFNSTKTFEKYNKSSTRFDANRTLERCNTGTLNHEIIDFSDRGTTRKERSMTQFNDQENNSYIENVVMTHNKTISCSESKFSPQNDSGSLEIAKSASKYSLNKYHTESRTSKNSPTSSGKDWQTSTLSKKGRIKIINQKAKTKRSNGWLVKDSPCLIQPLPSMKTVNNHKTFKETSLPRSNSAFRSLVETRVDKRDTSRNKQNLIFPMQTTRDISASTASIVNSACSIILPQKEKKVQSIIQCKRQKYSQNIDN